MKKRMMQLFLLLGAAVLGAQFVNAEVQTEKPAMESTCSTPWAEFVSPQDSLPRLRYLAEGKMTLNDRCPVRKVKLNPKMGASYVNAQPVGFC